ncbi:MAG: C-terminal binding protein [Caulobacteraceae bacterium]
MTTVLITDYAWPDLDIEHAVLGAAGLDLVAGPAVPAPAEAIEALSRERQPAAIMTNWAEVSAAAIAAPADLRIVQRLGVGLDNIDVAAATARGAWVANVPDYCVEEVSDHAVGLMLAWARGIVAFDRAVKRGAWEPSSARLHRVADLTVGLFGFGRIGRRIAEKLQPFGVRLLAVTRHPFDAGGVAVERVPLEAMLAAADAVIVNAPLNPDSHHLFDAARLGAMKPGAFLVNVSRGGIVDTPALIAALEAGHLSGAGLDVVEGEPDPPRALADRADVIITPHVAFSSAASLAELRRRACEEVVRVLRGEAPHNPCNRPV